MRTINNIKKMKQKSRKGFTIVEILVVAPIVILVIGVFISAIVGMTGDVLSSRGSTSLIYNIQDALNRIEQDVTISGAYLATNSITLTSPQGYLNNNSSNFHNADTTNGTSLILDSYATTANPYSAAISKIYLQNAPNACASPSISENNPLMMNTIYFVKNGTLWRRVIARSDYLTAGCSTPWQYASCNPTFVTGSYPFCKTQDEKLVEGIGTGGFSVEYYPGPNSTTPNSIANDSSKLDLIRQNAIQDNRSIVVTITATSNTAGRVSTQTATIRASRSENKTTPLNCPNNFIVVPGSSTYGTSDFCVMKYEAKDVGGVATSQAADYPWDTINQINASIKSTAACPGCHLITEAEWMTIAQNVLSVPSNWSGGAVGSGYIFSGLNDEDPDWAQVADSIDTNGYIGTNDSSGDAGVTNTMIGNTQRRTLTLTNGEVIWDLSGNIYEWTSGTNQAPEVQPGITGGGYAGFRDWNALTNIGTLRPNVFPSGANPNASGWNSFSNGIGRTYTSSDDTKLTGFIRGGNWDIRSNAGIFMLNAGFEPVDSVNYIGFRVAQSF